MFFFYFMLMKGVQEATCEIFGQLRQLINSTRNVYNSPVAILNQYTVGSHIRHILEFYKCLKKGIQNNEPIDYDGRKRDKRIEQEPDFALNVLIETKKFVQKSLDQPLQVKLLYGYAQHQNVHIESNLERELAYNIEHMVHHMAMIRMAIESTWPQIQLQKGFGVASSTLRYQASQA